VGTAFQNGNWKWLILSGALIVCCATAAGFYLTWGAGSADAETGFEDQSVEHSSTLHVDVIHPEKGKMPRITRQPGTVLSYDSARLFAEVSGYMKTEAVDIGDKVKRGDVLIVIDVPELQKLCKKWQAAIEQAKARVKQAEAHLITAQADVKAAQAKVVQARANRKSAHAWQVYCNLKLKRYQDLASTNSVEFKLVEEAQEYLDAAIEKENAAEAAISTAQADVESAQAKIDQANADIDSAKADVGVAAAESERAQVMVDFATIRSPYDGFITQRSLLPGDFVKAGSEGSGITPLLTVERTDKMRVVVQIPDRDVPYCDPGDEATIEIDALPDVKIPAKVSRIARSEDPQTKLMRVELDVPNKSGKLRQGMYGWVTVVLDPESEQLSIPSNCLVGKAQDGKGSVYVVEDGHAKLRSIHYGYDNGERVAVTGLTPRDFIITQAPPSLHDGAAVSFSK
jgi:RND family efflux transporter MFP subunit